LLVQYYKPGYNSRLFLFSDGLVNEGVKDKNVIQTRVENDIYVKSQITVSAFGLGDDFDEELMRGIADKGNGAYFFIEGAESIPAFVDFALKYILKMVGMGAFLKVRGTNGAIVTKIYGHTVEGAKLGDLREENIRTVLVKLNVKGDVVQGEVPVLNYELVYKKKENEEEKIAGSLSLIFTENEQEMINGMNPEVKIKLAIQKVAAKDKKLVKLMDEESDDDNNENNNDVNDDNDDEDKPVKFSKKTMKLIELQSKVIQLYEEVLDYDRDLFNGENKIESMLETARKTLDEIKENGATKKIRKDIHHQGYTYSRG